MKVLPVSKGTVQLTGSGDRMMICSGDLTRVGSGGDLIMCSIMLSIWDVCCAGRGLAPSNLSSPSAVSEIICPRLVIFTVIIKDHSSYTHIQYFCLHLQFATHFHSPKQTHIKTRQLEEHSTLKTQSFGTHRERKDREIQRITEGEIHMMIITIIYQAQKHKSSVQIRENNKTN